MTQVVQPLEPKPDLQTLDTRKAAEVRDLRDRAGLPPESEPVITKAQMRVEFPYFRR